MVTLEQLQVGINNYVDNEILAKTSGWNQFKYGFIKGALMDKIPKIINTYKDNPMVKTLDIMSDNGMVNIDNVYKWAKDAIQRSGQIIVGGLIFSENDIDKLYNSITSTTV